MGATIMANGGTAFIKQLLDAEKQGEDLIAKAKADRLTKLRQAKEKAEQELKAFTAEQEAKFQKDHASKNAADPAKELEASTKKEVDMVGQDYQTNKAKTVQYVCSKVLDVKVELSLTQKQALKAGTVL